MKILKQLGMPRIKAESNGGVAVQASGVPKLMLSEQEFLLFAAEVGSSLFVYIYIYLYRVN